MTSTNEACRLLAKSRATHYRRQQPPAPARAPRPRPVPPSKLTDAERRQILDVFHNPAHADRSVAQVWATLLDQGVYLASQSTMHRILREHGESRDRRNQATHPPRARPELLAEAPNEVWSWDITKLPGPLRGQWFDLYVMIDIFSRCVVHWIVAPGESAELAKQFITDAIAAIGGVAPKSIHADRGTSMTSKPVAALLVDLGVDRSHSRPHVSNDNPYSEAAFKTLKYCPAWPGRFGSIPDARGFCRQFFAYYNHEHRHSALGLHTPASVHHGTAARSAANGPPPSAPPTRPTRPDSADHPNHPDSRPPPGSTNPARRPSSRTSSAISLDGDSSLVRCEAGYNRNRVVDQPALDGPANLPSPLDGTEYCFHPDHHGGCGVYWLGSCPQAANIVAGRRCGGSRHLRYAAVAHSFGRPQLAGRLARLCVVHTDRTLLRGAIRAVGWLSKNGRRWPGLRLCGMRVLALGGLVDRERHPSAPDCNVVGKLRHIRIRTDRRGFEDCGGKARCGDATASKRPVL